MSKYKLKRLIDQFTENPREHQNASNVRRLYDDKKKELRVETALPSVTEFERRKFRFGTASESWAALHQIAKAIEEGKPIPAVPAVWLLSALNAMAEDSPKELVRALGFVQKGRSRTLNHFDVLNRMAFLIEKEGLPQTEAARVCASEFGCHFETALYYWRKKRDVFSK